MGELVLEVCGLTKKFNKFTAVHGLSFSIEEGEVFALLGANGAGKSTTLHMLVGMIEPTAGTVQIFRMNPRSSREAVFSRLNFTSPYMGFPQRLTVFENLIVYAALYGVPHAKAKIRGLLRRFAIDDLERSPVGRLSSGEVSCVGLCKALLNDPALLILDEPLSSLDPHAAANVQSTLNEIRRELGTAILYTSHNMFQVEQMCDRVLFLHHGRVVVQGTPLEVTRHTLGPGHMKPSLREVFLSIGGRQSHETP